MNPLPWWVVPFALIVVSIAIAILLDIRKRREVMDLLPGEARALKDLQENAKWPKEMKEVRPAGKPLYSDGRQHRGDRNRIMLGDLHKHYVLRSQPGYAERRKQANRVLHMADISKLDDYLRTA